MKWGLKKQNNKQLKTKKRRRRNEDKTKQSKINTNKAKIINKTFLWSSQIFWKKIPIMSAPSKIAAVYSSVLFYRIHRLCQNVNSLAWDWYIGLADEQIYSSDWDILGACIVHASTRSGWIIWLYWVSMVKILAWNDYSNIIRSIIRILTISSNEFVIGLVPLVASIAFPLECPPQDF